RPNGLSPIGPGISTEKSRPHRSRSPRAAPVPRAGDGRTPCRISWTDCHPPDPTTADSGHAMTQRATLRLILLASATLLIHAEGMAIAGPPDTEASPSRALTPDRAAAGFRVPPGFHVSVLAAEPDVENPVAMAWDPRGRLWVAENFTYAEL